MAWHSGTHHVVLVLVQEIHEPITSLDDTSIRLGDDGFAEQGEFDGFAVCAANGHYR